MADVFRAPGVHWTPVSWQLRVMRRVGVLLAVDVVLWVAWGVTRRWPDWALWAERGAAVALLLGAVAWVVAGRTARSWGYAERDEDLYIKHGTVLRQVVAVPYGRMQYVEVTAGPLQQVFGLATIRLSTASPTSRARIVGVTPREAARLRDRLTELGQIQGAGL